MLAPPKNHLMLPGITYDVVLELAKEHEIAHEVRAISEHEVRTADELAAYVFNQRNHADNPS